jgi:20S proteasome alpha/beta subunit
MTLIVGFKCGDSVVLCADSQETRGGLKREVNKLPIINGDDACVSVVCGGAGQGELSDAFVARLGPAMKRSPTCGEEPLRRELEGIAAGFHQSAVYRSFPGTSDDKFIAGLIGVCDPARQTYLFKFAGPTVKSVATYDLAGEEFEFYERIPRRRYRVGLSINQAVILGIEIINEAKSSSIYVGGPTNVVIVRPNGIKAQADDRVQWTEAHIATQNELIDSLRIDLSSTSAQVTEKLNNFSSSITAVRGLYGAKYGAWPTPTLSDDPDDPTKK